MNLRPNTELKDPSVTQVMDRDVDTSKGTLTKKNAVPMDFLKQFINGIQRNIFDDKDPTKLTEKGQQTYDYVSKRTGGESTVKPLTQDNPYYRPGVGGFVPFKDPSTVYVNPQSKGQDYILAHELAHSQAKTPISEKFQKNILGYGFPYDLDKVPSVEGYDRFAGSTFRHMFENEVAPRVIEEANAQGVAVGTMRGLNQPEKDPYYRDPRDYPTSIGMRKLYGLDAREGTFMDVKKDPYTGEDLGVKDVFGNTTYPQMSLPASFHSEDVYNTLERIEKNMKPRINRQYQLGIDLMK